jgi:O-methyltransferase involved in polyketide biosynthesis
MQPSKDVFLELDEVSQTTAKLLIGRAKEASRKGSILHDPVAVDVCRSNPWIAEQCGPVTDFHSIFIASRSAAFDGIFRDFIRTHPDSTIVALGEGLETTFWRVDNGAVNWASVDLPGPSRVREDLLPSNSRLRCLPFDARNRQWVDEIAESKGPVLVSAQGLLMYFSESEVHDLISLCAAAFPGGGIIFDAVSRWFVSRTSNPGTRRRAQVPQMQWGINPGERSSLCTIDSRICEIRDVPLPRGRGAKSLLSRMSSQLPWLREMWSSITLLGFSH